MAKNKPAPEAIETRAEERKLRTLQDRAQQLDFQIRDTERAIARGQSLPNAKANFNSEVEAVLSGGAVATVALPQVDYKAKLAELRREKEILYAAIERQRNLADAETQRRTIQAINAMHDRTVEIFQAFQAGAAAFEQCHLLADTLRHELAQEGLDASCFEWPDLSFLWTYKQRQVFAGQLEKIASITGDPETGKRPSREWEVARARADAAEQVRREEHERLQAKLLDSQRRAELLALQARQREALANAPRPKNAGVVAY